MFPRPNKSIKENRSKENCEKSNVILIQCILLHHYKVSHNVSCCSDNVRGSTLTMTMIIFSLLLMTSLMTGSEWSQWSCVSGTWRRSTTQTGGRCRGQVMRNNVQKLFQEHLRKGRPDRIDPFGQFSTLSAWTSLGYP